MRQITQESINAFMNEFTFNKSNTIIKVYNDVVKMYLHDNMIAIKDRTTNKISITNAGWESNTTKERLNGIPGVSIQQKNFVWYLNDKQWNGNLITI
jgi:hypothetical protein